MCMCWCNANIFDVHWTFAKEKINQASRSLCAYVCVCACECACDSCVTKNYGKQQKPGQVFSQNTKIKRIDSGAGWKTIFATTTNICNKRIREGERELRMANERVNDVSNETPPKSKMASRREGWHASKHCVGLALATARAESKQCKQCWSFREIILQEMLLLFCCCCFCCCCCCWQCNPFFGLFDFNFNCGASFWRPLSAG